MNPILTNAFADELEKISGKNMKQFLDKAEYILPGTKAHRALSKRQLLANDLRASRQLGTKRKGTRGRPSQQQHVEKSIRSIHAHEAMFGR